MFSSLKVGRAIGFGEELAKAFIVLLPKDKVLTDSKRLSKLNYAKEKLNKMIRLFIQEEPLNFYKTARLLNTFKWALLDEGYDQAFIDDLTSWVLGKLRESQV